MDSYSAKAGSTQAEVSSAQAEVSSTQRLDRLLFASEFLLRVEDGLQLVDDTTVEEFLLTSWYLQK